MRAYKLKKCKRVHGIHFAPDGKRLFAFGGIEARVVDAAVWLDLETGDNDGRVERFATCVAADPGLTRYAIGGENERGSRIPAIEWTELGGPVEWRRFAWLKRNLPPSYKNVCGLAFDPTGSRLAVGHAHRVARRDLGDTRWLLSVVNPNTGEPEAQFSVTHDPSIVRFNSDGERVAVTGGLDGDPRVSVFAGASGRALFGFAPPATSTRAIAFLPDNRLAIANGRNVYVLPADSATPQFTLEGHPKQVNAVAATPDGRHLLTAAHDGSIRTWDARDGAPGGAFDWNIGPVTALAFAPDGLTCAAAGLNGKVVVWDLDA